jgi:hypothetical protein
MFVRRSAYAMQPPVRSSWFSPATRDRLDALASAIPPTQEKDLFAMLQNKNEINRE